MATRSTAGIVAGGGSVGEARPQRHRLAQIDVAQVALSLRRVDVEQHADAARDATGDGDLAGAEQRHLVPAQLARGQGGIGGVEVVGHGEERAGDIRDIEGIARHQPFE